MAYNKNNVKKLEKTIKEAKAGEEIYINAVNITANGIELVRNYVKSGVLVPDKKEVEVGYKDVEAGMRGDVVLPQMIYIRK